MKRTRMICKKVTRFLVISLITIFAVFSSAHPAKADTIQAHGTVSTSYGSYTWSAQQAASTLPVTITLPFIGISFPYNSGTSFSIDFSLKNQYSGVVTITVTGNNTWSIDNVNILTSGCNLDSLPSDHAQYKTSHSFNLRLKNSDKFSFVIYGAGSTVFLGSTSVSVAHNMSVDNLEQQIDASLDLYLPGMSTSLSNLYSGIGYDGNSSNSLQADTLAFDIAIIKNYIDDIEGYLSAGNSYIDQLEGYVDGIESSLNNISSVVTSLRNNQILLSRPLWQHSIIFWGLTYSDISIMNGTPAFTYYTSYNDNAFTSSHAFRVQPHSTVQLYIGSYYSIGAHNTQLYYNVSDSNGITHTFTTYADGTNPSIYYNVISVINDSNNLVSVDVEFTANRTLYLYYLGNSEQIPDEVSLLYGIGFKNTYTNLLQGIINAVGNISQQQIIENNTNINNYNNYQTQINNVENNYYNEYNTYNTDIQNNNTFDFSGLSSDGVTVYQNLFTSVFQIDLIKWPLLIILLGLIVVIILG